MALPLMSGHLLRRMRGRLKRCSRDIHERLGRHFIEQICEIEYSNQQFTRPNERPIEYRFALSALAAARPRAVLDVGTGTTAWPHLLATCGFVVTAIDNIRDYWPHGMVNRHWLVIDEDITRPRAIKRSFQAVTCVSVLEHIKDHEMAVQSMWRFLEPGGVLVLTCPYNDGTYSPNVYERPDALYGQSAPYICQSYSASELKQWLDIGFQLERRELWRLFTGPVWATGAMTAWERVESVCSPHQLGCFVLKKC